jgi:hypothetical protein
MFEELIIVNLIIIVSKLIYGVLGHVESLGSLPGVGLLS